MFVSISSSQFMFFFFNYPATTEIYTYCHTLSLHDALPIYTDAAVPAIADLTRCRTPPPAVSGTLPIVFLDQPGRQLPSRPDVDRANLDDRPWSTAAGNQWDILAIYGSCREWRVLGQSCLRMEPSKPSASARSGIIGPERLWGIAVHIRMCRNLNAILRFIC